MKVKISDLNRMIREAIEEQVEPKLTADAAALGNRQDKAAGLDTAAKKINTPQEATQAILATLATYNLDKRGQIVALVNAVNTLRGGKGGGVAEAVVTEQEEDVYDNEDTQRTIKNLSYGQIPSVEELEDLMDGEEFDMELKGMDSLAMEYATVLSDEPLAGITVSPRALRYTLEALMNAPDPDELSDEQYSEASGVLEEWATRYGNESITDTCQSLASSIMSVLGVEWV